MIRQTPLTGLDMNIAAKLRARRPVRPVARPRIIPPRPGAVKPTAPAVDPLWTRANNQVMQFMNPMLARLAAQRVAAESNARAVAPQHVTALQGQLQVGAGKMDESFNRGIVADSAVNDALANRLNAVGGGEQASLSAKLAQIGAQDQGEIAKTYQGASNAGFATGAAGLQQLIAERANAGAYQAKLPGIAALQGNKDLQQALSEMRQNFGEQEKGLQDQASEQSFGLWDKLRGEKREDQVSMQRALQDEKDRASKDKLALQALYSTAQTNAEKMRFTAMMKAADRQTQVNLANIRADTARYGVDTRAATAAAKPVKGPSLTGPENQKFITVNGKVVKNPNYVPPAKRSSSSTSAPSGSQTAVTYNEIVKRIVNSEGLIRSKYAVKPDLSIAQEINKGLALRKIPKNSPEGKRIRKEIFAYLNNKRINWKVDGEYGTYTTPDWAA